MAVRDEIDRYITYFQAQNREIAGIAYPTFKKILYVVEIDTLSRAAFPKITGNRERIVRFIDTCSHWQDKDKVSVVQLKLALEKQCIRSGPLYDVIHARISSWGYGHIIRPDDDLTRGEAQRLATPDERRHVDAARYAQLLYEYRNSLLHEFREPAHGVDLGTDLPPAPYYLDTDLPGGGQRSWELVFPVQFL